MPDPTHKPSLSELFETTAPSELEKKIEQLEQQLEGERDCRREDRFLAFVVVMILFDVLLLDKAQNVSVPIIVFLLELMFFIVIAKRMGVQQIAGILDRLLNHFARKSGE